MLPRGGHDVFSRGSVSETKNTNVRLASTDYAPGGRPQLYSLFPALMALIIAFGSGVCMIAGRTAKHDRE